MTDLPAPFIERTRRLLGDDYPRFDYQLYLEIHNQNILMILLFSIHFLHYILLPTNHLEY